jgi:hypothetical protein
MRRSLIVFGLLLVAGPARAQRQWEPLYTPSTFSYGFHGFLLGASAGVGVGYLAGRSGGFQRDEWRSLAYGAGVGALTGGALGLGLGISDMAYQTPGRGWFVLRDGGYGLAFGGATGVIVGGLSALSANDSERIVVGAAVGGLVGTVFGLILGVVEGQRWQRPLARLSLAAASGADGRLRWMPALSGRF